MRKNRPFTGYVPVLRQKVTKIAKKIIIMKGQKFKLRKRKFPLEVLRFFNSPELILGGTNEKRRSHPFLYVYKPRIYARKDDPNKPFRIPAIAVYKNGVKVYKPAF